MRRLEKQRKNQQKKKEGKTVGPTGEEQKKTHKTENGRKGGFDNETKLSEGLREKVEKAATTTTTNDGEKVERTSRSRPIAVDRNRKRAKKKCRDNL